MSVQQQSLYLKVDQDVYSKEFMYVVYPFKTIFVSRKKVKNVKLLTFLTKAVLTGVARP